MDVYIYALTHSTIKAQQFKTTEYCNGLLAYLTTKTTVIRVQCFLFQIVIF